MVLSRDGNTAVVGWSADNGNIGATWVYRFSGGAWAADGGKLVGTGFSGASKQGFSVAASADGNMLLIGAPGDNGG